MHDCHNNAELGGAGDIESAAYLTSYNPANLCQNYLGDRGVVGLGTTVPNVSYSFTVPAQANFVVVVNTTGTTTSSQFSGTVSGFFDTTPGPALVQQALLPLHLQRRQLQRLNRILLPRRIRHHVTNSGAQSHYRPVARDAASDRLQRDSGRRENDACCTCPASVIDYIDIDEYVEARPESLRLRKRILDATARKRAAAAA